MYSSSLGTCFISVISESFHASIGLISCQIPGIGKSCIAWVNGSVPLSWWSSDGVSSFKNCYSVSFLNFEHEGMNQHCRAGYQPESTLWRAWVPSHHCLHQTVGWLCYLHLWCFYVSWLLIQMTRTITSHPRVYRRWVEFQSSRWAEFGKLSMIPRSVELYKRFELIDSNPTWPLGLEGCTKLATWSILGQYLLISASLFRRLLMTRPCICML